MKISIIIPVYNEEAFIEETLKSLINQKNFRKSDFEIVVVDDGSTDKTKICLEKYGLIKSVKILKNRKNVGRLMARQIGAKSAKYGHLLFVDARCVADNSLLYEISRINYQPLIGNVVFAKKSIFDRFSYLLRKKIYVRGGFGRNFKPVFLNSKNFDKIPKGTGILFIKKNLFLKSQPALSSYVSDDTKLLRNVLKFKPILKHYAPKVTYNSRNNLKSYLIHIYARGPKFVDYYFNKKKYIYLFYLSLIIILICFLFFFYLQSLFFIIFFLLLISVSIYFSENLSDFFIFIFIFPLVVGFFYMGLLKGFFLNIREVLF